MGFYADALVKAQAALIARLDGGEVESYQVGTLNVSLCSLKDLRELIKDLKAEAEAEAANDTGESRFHLANMRPGG